MHWGPSKSTSRRHRFRSDGSAAFSIMHNWPGLSYFNKFSELRTKWLNLSALPAGPLSGFVEFKTKGKQKQPFYVQAASGKTLAIAALWECWQNQVWSTAMITQPASESFAEVHDRMPLSLNAGQIARWMNPDEDVKNLLQDLHGQSAELQWRPIDSRVNNSRNKDGVVFL